MKKTVVALLLIVGMGSISIPNTGYAMEDETTNQTNEIQPRYSVILSSRGNITKSGNRITVSASFSSRISTSLHIQMNLQENIDGRWRTVKTWNKSANKSTGLADSQNFSGSSGSSYRLLIQFSAGDETTSLISY